MRGISFCIPNNYNKYLWEIFKFVDFSQYTWYITQDEILYFDKKEGRVNNTFFKKTILTGPEFKDQIIQSDYYIYLANIQAYPINSKQDSILTYTDFQKSKCEIILLCADSVYIDLYSKNEGYIKRVYNMCMQSGFKNVEYITDSNDQRTRLKL